MSDGTPTAEQLAIALMAEARKLMNLVSAPENETVPWTAIGPLDDRLAQWATDVRQLGVDWSTTLHSYQMAAQEMKEQRDEARAVSERRRQKLVALGSVAEMYRMPSSTRERLLEIVGRNEDV